MNYRKPYRPRMRKYFFGRFGLGAWPVIILVIALSLSGGVNSMEEFAARALPIVVWGSIVFLFCWLVVVLRRRRRGY